MPNVRLSVELKVETPQIVEKVIDLIKKYDRANYTRFNLKDYNQYVWDLNFISTEVSDFEQNFMSVLYLSGLTPFIKHGMHTYYMPFISKWLQEVILENGQRRGKMLTYTQILGATIIKELAHMYVWHMEKRGIEMGFWVINNEEDFDIAL